MAVLLYPNCGVIFHGSSGQRMASLNFDVIVCGGGMTGLAVAAQLAHLDLTVAVLEDRRPQPFLPEQQYDLRVSALSPQTILLLEQLNAWHRIQTMRSCPYRRMRVWEMQRFGDVTFEAEDIGRSELGFIVENRIVQTALWESVEALPQVKVLCPAACRQFDRNAGHMVATLEDGRRLTAKLIVGADGADSAVRNAFDISISRREYEQSCLVASVATRSAQQDMTWQRFTPLGPQAFLPLLGSRGSLVWYQKRDRVRELAQLDNSELAELIMAEFPKELGDIEIAAKGSFPIQKQHAKTYVQQGVALIGDAAHTINPLAGQGVNLGFQDSTRLTEVISGAMIRGKDWSSRAVLLDYERQRRWANGLMMRAMDGFYYGFSNNNVPLRWARNSLLAGSNMPFIKESVLRYASGLVSSPTDLLYRKKC